MQVFHQRMLNSHFGQECLSALLPALKDEFPLTAIVLVNRYLSLHDLACWKKLAFLCLFVLLMSLCCYAGAERADKTVDFAPYKHLRAWGEYGNAVKCTLISI